MNKWKVISIFKNSECECKICGKETYNPLAVIWHHKHILQLDGVCEQCISNEFDDKTIMEYNILLELYEKWLFLKDGKKIYIHEFSYNTLYYILEGAWTYPNWKDNYFSVAINEWKGDYYTGKKEAIDCLNEIIIPFIKYHRMLGEWE